MEQTLLRYVALYNHQLPQSALTSKTPIQAMKEWYGSYPHLLFHKRPYDRPGYDVQDSQEDCIKIRDANVFENTTEQMFHE